MSQVVVVAKIKIKEEFYLEVYKELLLVYKYTLANDEGCLQYDLHNDIDDKHTFAFVETWENQDALDAHAKTDHFMDFVKSISDKIEDLKINRLIKIEI
ncbi:MAG: antibiotic biosynthesis monooxygenase [Campylobacteraceae bacterium]|nr:antibiotic biosynthesis monooxygenase [Campylobacteraceae bacterium]